MENYIVGITHCSFYCNDYEKMLHFYRDTLEIPAIFTLRNEDGTPWLTYLKVAQRQFIELFNDRYAPSAKWGEYSFSHVSLLVSDIFEAVRTLEATMRPSRCGRWRRWAIAKWNFVPRIMKTAGSRRT